MLPSPSTSFTIPSIQDDTVLDCRLYLPSSFVTAGPVSSRPWRKKAAIVAHPYGPMGGSYDDPIVDLVGSTLLKQDYLVGTFNFRGAGGSKGRTSWTAKAETNDYISFVGFMVYLTQELQSSASGQSSPFDDDFPRHDLSPIPSHVLPATHSRDSKLSKHPQSHTMLNEDGGLLPKPSDDDSVAPLLLMAGYSYGSMVTTLLPSLPNILSQFDTPQLGTAAAEIRLRATQLAKTHNEMRRITAKNYMLQMRSENGHSPQHQRGRSLCVNEPASPRRGHTSSSSIRVGGEESDPEHRRASMEISGRRSFEPSEAVRRSIDRVRIAGRKHNHQVLSPKRHVSYNSGISSKKSVRPQRSIVSMHVSTNDDIQLDNCIEGVALGPIEVAYLLISPLQGLVNNLATMWTTSLLKTRAKGGESSDEEAKLFENRTLAIWGDSDAFTSSKKLQDWSDKLRSKHESLWRGYKILGAGHFWHEEGAAYKMRDAVDDFVKYL